MESSLHGREPLDWDKLRIFREVAHLGSMSSAAARLGGSLPTISRRITELERELRADLFRRSTKGVSLTDAGAALLYHADRIADVVNALQNEVMDHTHSDTGPVHISACDMLGTYWVASHLQDFVSANPALEPQLTICSADPEIGADAFDVSIQLTRPPRPDLIALRLGRLQFSFFMAKPETTDIPVPASFRDLRHHHCLVLEEYVQHLVYQTPPSRDLGRVLDQATRSNSMAALVNIGRTGRAFVLLPSYMHDLVPDLIPLPNLKIVPVEFWMVYPERLRRLQKGLALLEWLRDIFKSGGKPWFQEVPFAFSDPSQPGI